MPTNERVLVIPTEHFRAAGYFHGFRAADEVYRRSILDPGAFSFRPRFEVENDPSFKQLIPYVVLRCGDQIYQYRRGKSGTEARLRALRSIGIGGHISEEDAAGGSDPYLTGMARELTEEVDIRTSYRERLVGFINDDTVHVGKMHLGVVHVCELTEPLVHAREDALAEAGFETLASLLAARDDFETWSQFVLESL
jgi:predicted NUDIX family phosphoesterase